jgi:hypothetical protein
MEENMADITYYMRHEIFLDRRYEVSGHKLITPQTARVHIVLKKQLRCNENKVNTKIRN